jgi:hypothetical protein
MIPIRHRRLPREASVFVAANGGVMVDDLFGYAFGFYRKLAGHTYDSPRCLARSDADVRRTAWKTHPTNGCISLACEKQPTGQIWRG